MFIELLVTTADILISPNGEVLETFLICIIMVQCILSNTFTFATVVVKQNCYNVVLIKLISNKIIMPF